MHDSIQAPQISVVMAVYGNWDDLAATLESVLRQSHSGFELILVDDGNPEPGKSIIRKLADSDARIRLLVNELNQGLTLSLIRGCSEARSEFIARIDCGDLMVPDQRLEMQHRALVTDSGLALVSGGIELWDLINRKRWRSRLKYRSHEEIARRPRYTSWADHPTVMFRKTAYEQAGGYSRDWPVGQDTELWPRLAEHGRFAGLPEVFALRTLSPGSISVARNAQQVRGKIKRMKQLGDLSPFKLWALAGREYLKLLVPMKQRLNIRNRAAMDYVGIVPEQVVPPLYVRREDASEFAQNEVALREYVVSSMAEFITGRRDPSRDSDWNAFLQDLDRRGLSNYLSIVQSSYDSSPFGRRN